MPSLHRISAVLETEDCPGLRSQSLCPSLLPDAVINTRAKPALGREGFGSQLEDVQSIKEGKAWKSRWLGTFCLWSGGRERWMLVPSSLFSLFPFHLVWGSCLWDGATRVQGGGTFPPQLILSETSSQTRSGICLLEWICHLEPR